MDTLTLLYSECEKNGAPYLRHVLDGVTEAVGGSFVADNATRSKAEVKRRAGICARWFLVFKRDLDWSTQRAMDALPKALRSELDGIPFTPDREGKSTWAADNGRDLAWLPKT